MAIIRTLHNSENTLNYVGTLSFLCAISCTIIMFRFRGFKATFNISQNNQSSLLVYNDSPGVSLTGAYRTNKDELYGNTSYPNPPKKITPSMVSLPASQSGHRKDISKSTNNLARPLNETVHITKSTPNIPEAAAAPLTRTQIKEQKKLEKQRSDEQKKRLDEQKKQAKLAAKEQEKAEKLKKEREKQLLKKQAEEKKKSTRTAPPPPQTQNVQLRPEIKPQSERPHSTNTLDSSISRSSGPPPYSPKDVVQENNKSERSEDVTFTEQDSSWDMVSQHRQQINRALAGKSSPKQTQLDLNYNVGSNDTDNSRA